MAFASFFLLPFYIVLLCVSFTLGAILPLSCTIVGILCLIALIPLVIVNRRLKKQEKPEAELLQEKGGYGKIITRNILRVGIGLLIVIACACFLICAGILMLLYC